jgi:hypothetical protein
MEYIFLARRLSASYLIPSGNAASRYCFAVIRSEQLAH